MDMEDIQFRFESVLRKCPAEVLEEVAKGIGVADTEVQAAGQVIRSLLRLIQTVFYASQPDELNKAFLKCLPHVPNDVSQKLMSILVQKNPSDRQ